MEHDQSLASKPSFRDIVGGLVVFLVAVPLCLGIAHASGAPIISGLITGIIAGIVVGSLSGSHVSVSGPAAGLTAVVLAQLEALGSYEAFLLALFLSGGFQILFGAIKAGTLANYFPTSVVKGLLAAIGVILILKQIPHLVGHDPDYEGDMSFFQEDGLNTFSELLAITEQFLPGAALIGISCLVLLIAWQKSPLQKTIFPAPLAAILLGVGINEIFRFTDSAMLVQGTDHMVNVPIFNSFAELKTKLPSPDFSAWSNPRIYVGALTIALVASLETLLNLEATDQLDTYKRSSSPNRELLAQGVGNTLSGLVGGMPMTSVIVRSSVNVQVGSTSKLSAIFHGFLLLISVALFPQILNRIPLAALAAILLMIGYKLAKPSVFKEMKKHGISQFAPFLITLLAIVFTDLLIGVVIGLISSVFFILKSNTQRGFHKIEEQHMQGPVLRLVLASQVSFLNRAQFARTFDEELKEGDQVIIDARTTDYIDPDIIERIHQFVHEQAPERGITVTTIGLKEHYDTEDHVQHINISSRDLQENMTPKDVLKLLEDGNKRFVSGDRIYRDLARQVDATSDGQHPLAVVLSCIDSRVAAELVFDLGLGDIFSTRVAGNVAAEKVLASMEYACQAAGSKLIVVLGHTRCGAVGATCDLLVHKEAGVSIEQASIDTGMHNLQALTTRIGPAVEQAMREFDHPEEVTPALVDCAARHNVENVLALIQTRSPGLSAMLERGEILLVGGMYDVKTGKVDFFTPQGARPDTSSDESRV